MNAIDFFDHGWSIDPSAPCMIDGVSGETWDYARVRTMTLRTANALRDRGYGVADKAAVLSDNLPASYATVLAILRAGITFVPVNPRNAAHDNAAILHAFECRILFYHSSFEDVVVTIADSQSGIREFVCIDSTSPRFPSLDHWQEGAGLGEIELAHDPDHVFAIQATGGTTGFPKGVLITNGSLENTVAGCIAAMPSSKPRFLAVAPLTHAAGMVMQSVLAQGGCGILFRRMDKERILAAIARFRISHVFLPPTLIYDLLEYPDVRAFDYSDLRYLIYGAAPMSPARLRSAIEVFGPVLCQVYGQTESGLPNTFLSAADHFIDGEIANDERLSSCGRATAFTKVAIIDDEGRVIDRGEIGEIGIRGQGVSPGYFNDAKATAEMSINGWHRTGDIGFQDAEGFFHIVDRRKDMIVSGGFNIYSAEVEAALSQHPDVHACAVIGVPDPRWGEVVKAVVEMRSGRSLDAPALIAFCKTRIGSMKAPKSVEAIDALPRSAVGKILKRELRKPYWEGHDRQVS